MSSLRPHRLSRIHDRFTVGPLGREVARDGGAPRSIDPDGLGPIEIDPFDATAPGRTYALVASAYRSPARKHQGALLWWGVVGALALAAAVVAWWPADAPTDLTSTPATVPESTEPAPLSERAPSAVKPAPKTIKRQRRVRPVPKLVTGGAASPRQSSRASTVGALKAPARASSRPVVRASATTGRPKQSRSQPKAAPTAVELVPVT